MAKKKEKNNLLGTCWLRIFTGLPGSGKSYYAVRQIAGVLADGGNVYTNLEIAPDEGEYHGMQKTGMRRLLRDRFGVELEDPEMDGTIPGYHYLTSEECARVFESVPDGTPTCRNLVVIDEAHKYWPAGGKVPQKLLEYLSEVRHHCTEVILITQDTSRIIKSVRCLCNWWEFRDLATLKVFGWVPVGDRLIGIERPPGSKAKALQKIRQVRDQLVYGAYFSRQFEGDGPKASPQKVEKVEGGKKWRFGFRWWIVPLVLLVWYVTHLLSHYFGGSKKPGLPADAPAAAAPVHAGMPAKQAAADNRTWLDKVGGKKAENAWERVEAPELPYPLLKDPTPVPVVVYSVRPSYNRETGKHDGPMELRMASPPAAQCEIVKVGDYSQSLRGVIQSLAGELVVIRRAGSIVYGHLQHTSFTGVSGKLGVAGWSSSLNGVGPPVVVAGADGDTVKDQQQQAQDLHNQGAQQSQVIQPQSSTEVRNMLPGP